MRATRAGGGSPPSRFGGTSWEFGGRTFCGTTGHKQNANGFMAERIRIPIVTRDRREHLDDWGPSPYLGSSYAVRKKRSKCRTSAWRRRASAVRQRLIWPAGFFGCRAWPKNTIILCLRWLQLLSAGYVSYSDYSSVE